MASRVLSSIVCGRYNSVFYAFCIGSNGRISVMGQFRRKRKLEFFSELSDIISIQVDSGNAICLAADGSVFTFGSNYFGELGVGKDASYSEFLEIPQRVSSLPSIIQISCGYAFNVCLSADGELYSFGNNDHGQLGFGDTNYVTSPQKIPELAYVEFVECGHSFVVCKTLNNQFYCWGNNRAGQLGINTKESKTKPFQCTEYYPNNIVDIKCGKESILVLTSNQEVFSCGNYGSTSLEKISNLSNIIRIECGYDHTMFIDSNQDLYISGYNDFGQLGIKTNGEDEPVKHPLSNILDISKGGNHTFVKTSDNEIFSFGDIDYSILGIEEETFHNKPVRVFEDNEDIWCSHINKPKAKSARSVI